MRKELFWEEEVGEGDYLASYEFDKTLHGGLAKDAWYLTLNDFLLGHTMRFLDDEALQDGRN